MDQIKQAFRASLGESLVAEQQSYQLYIVTKHYDLEQISVQHCLAHLLLAID
jgi:hypothetical protein